MNKYYNIIKNNGDEGWALVFEDNIRKLDKWVRAVNKLEGKELSSYLFEDIYDIPDNEKERYEQQAEYAINCVLTGYDTWKLQRERLLTGRMGSFYDFGELAPIIANFAKFRNCITYSGLTKELKRYISAFTLDGDEFYKLYRGDLEDIRAGIEDNIDNLEQFTIGAALQTSSKFNVYVLSFIYVKILPMAKFEVELSDINI